MENNMYTKNTKTTSSFGRFLMLSLTLVLIIFSANKSSALVQTYVIAQSQLVNCGSTCGANSYYNGCSGAAGFGWTDVLSTGAPFKVFQYNLV